MQSADVFEKGSGSSDGVRELFVAKSSLAGNKYAALGKDEEVILVTKSGATGDNALNLWYVNGGATGDDSSDDTIVLLGTVAGNAAISLETTSFTTI